MFYARRLVSENLSLTLTNYVWIVTSLPGYKPPQNPLRSCMSPGLISGVLRYRIRILTAVRHYQTSLVVIVSISSDFYCLFPTNY